MRPFFDRIFIYTQKRCSRRGIEQTTGTIYKTEFTRIKYMYVYNYAAFNSFAYMGFYVSHLCIISNHVTRIFSQKWPHKHYVLRLFMQSDYSIYFHRKAGIMQINTIVKINY